MNEPSNWYFAEGNGQRGPVALTALADLVRTGVVRADALVWRSGMPGWTQARSVPELAAFIPPPPMPPLPFAPVAAPRLPALQPPEIIRPKDRAGRVILGGIVVAIIVVMLANTSQLKSTWGPMFWIVFLWLKAINKWYRGRRLRILHDRFQIVDYGSQVVGEVPFTNIACIDPKVSFLGRTKSLTFILVDQYQSDTIWPKPLVIWGRVPMTPVLYDEFDMPLNLVENRLAARLASGRQSTG